MSLSKIVLSGQVVKQPEKRYTPQTNVAKTEFFIAVESMRQENKSDPSPIKVITWRDLAERCSTQFNKGDYVTVEGRLQINNYVAQDGSKKRNAEIEAQSVECLPVGVSTSSPSMAQMPAVKQVAVLQTAQAPKLNNIDLNNVDVDMDSIFATEDEIPF